ncbi:GTP-binding protein [Trypanosoma rangeli]|uniref:GTP-binding protein n=1 Tax=Trypanosoma rangeli TaxID=5698 RepID=A0A422MX57_TRYRA|nr:GTP-binding protein [Trypanosoma rangeli]RNE97751.1 GTP-binding protein [Trypanosoma rangeli]|eukprot:RNE97751.1 GTP-binding protein [Trypanosoma rangeli]
MACRFAGARRLVAPHVFAGSTRLFHSSRLVRNAGKIIIPKLAGGWPTHGEGDIPTAFASPSPSSAASAYRSEYRENNRLGPDVAQFLDAEAADTLRRQQQLDHFRTATDAAVSKVWRDSKGHLRRQENLVREFGVEGAVREMLQPTRVSFRQELRQRPLDRGILEEIYKGLHGRRIERRLKRGVSWEHWITKGDGTAPVFTASRKAQQTFAFGGTVRLATKAIHAKQFPILLTAGRRADSSGSNMELGETQRCVPEVAFVGRTSSGKSSLINAVLNALIAPYGHLQGTTSSVNFYNVANKVVLVDCPGYGYYNPMETPAVDAENAIAVMRAYLKACSRHSTTTRKNERTKEKGHVGGPAAAQIRPIKRVFVCVSSRGVQQADTAYLDYLEGLGVPFTVVLTKTDAAPIRFLARLADHTRCQLVHYKHCKELLLTSSLRLAGIDKVQNLIGSMALGEDRLYGATTDFSSIV